MSRPEGEDGARVRERSGSRGGGEGGGGGCWGGVPSLEWVSIFATLFLDCGSLAGRD